MNAYLDFEKPVAELDGKIEELRRLSADDATVNVADEIQRLEAKSAQALRDIYARLTPWQKTQVARHPARPHFFDYVKTLVDEFTPLAGDRGYGDDNAIVGGLGRMRGRPVVVMGHEKGHDTKSRLKHNFGMAMPEGYRKAVRLMGLAEQFGLPVVSLVDTAGAFPGVGAEERGQAEAIARSTEKCLSLSVPMVSVIIGEGGSGGAVAIATANTVLMLEHSVYSVISPEACSSILWRSPDKAQDAANAMKVTAQDLLGLKVIDGIIPEPLGGAHRDPMKMIHETGTAIDIALKMLSGRDGNTLKRERREKFLSIGRTLAA
ncbi:MAG TPA: acetyl-CoA carboxylase carboxyltransferase subunit alpha [Micropepsaceae bacterium]|nr:acetyl-CoA carboxylase carboxyltransferase subunit alpha [Micropepsaceae bacterium]HRK71822.1 acetyl-CoA carboxylase carboxyltransferase subunit alpha [Micropepsaceae bacterium]